MPKRKKTRWEPEHIFERRMAAAKRPRRIEPRAVGPRTALRKLKYYAATTIDAGIGGIAAVHVFSANGLYDPDITGVGNQPRGFDQYMAMYDHCVCIASKITTWCETGDTNDLVFFVAIRDGSSTSSSIRDYLELDDTVFQQQVAGHTDKKLISQVAPHKYLGRSKPLSDPNLRTSASSNPGEGVFYHVGVRCMNSTDPAVANVHAIIEYTVVFIEPKDPGSS